MTDGEWEEIDVPQGAYMSWASRPGQRVIGKIIDYEPHGGRDLQEEPCPLLTVLLAEPTYAVNKDGDRREFDADEMIMVNCSLYNLKKGVKFANVERGDMINIHYYDTTKVDKGDAKQFKIKVLRAAKINSRGDHEGHRTPPPSGAPQYAGTVPRNDAPPF
jgi:hypothetical protein